MDLTEQMFMQHRAQARIETLTALNKVSGDYVQAISLLGTAIEMADAQSDFERGDTLCCAIRQLVLDKDEVDPLDADLADEGFKVVMRMATGCQDLSRQARRMLVALDIGHKKREAYSDQQTVEGCIEALGMVTAAIADRGDVEFALKLLPSLCYGSSDVLACAALARALTLQGEETRAYVLVEERKAEADRDEPR